MSDRVLNDSDILFEIFDVNGTGYLNLESLQQVNAELGEMLSDEDLTDILREAGPDGICKEEFHRRILVDSESR